MLYQTRAAEVLEPPSVPAELDIQPELQDLNLAEATKDIPKDAVILETKNTITNENKASRIMGFLYRESSLKPDRAFISKVERKVIRYSSLLATKDSIGLDMQTWRLCDSIRWRRTSDTLLQLHCWCQYEEAEMRV